MDESSDALQYEDVKQHFLAALDLPPEAVEAWLGELALRAPAVAARVRVLLDAQSRIGDFMAVDDRATVLPPPRIGSFLVERELGRGGMGLVLLGSRDAEGFTQRVAIKIVAGASADARHAERLAAERRILASLNHPFIAHFVDGGTTADGQPYIAMEYVEGVPINAYCSQHGLGVRDRIRLMLKVCDAVHFAHRRLVVHRDIKPSNILVTADGTPKLLDFGIAKLVDPEESDATRTVRILTPHYASPEQVEGLPVTTSTDVYSLGVLLYELLTGAGPYRTVTSASNPLAVLDAIRNELPERPSVAAARGGRPSIDGDLDAVLLKALRKEEADRYGSVEQLANDLRRFLDGRPVDARAGTRAYLLRKFVARHRATVVAAGSVVLVLIAGMASTAWQARVARQERDKAQNRLRQVQEFSRSLLFDVHDALRVVPGATAPRRLLLERATSFLDGLSADAGDDDALKAELAEGYRRLGGVQGLAADGNVGDTASARTSLEKAVSLAEAALTASASVERLTIVMRAQYDLATLLVRRGVPAEADAAVRRLESVVVDLSGRAADSQAQLAAAEGYRDLGAERTGRAHDLNAARAYHERSLRLYEGLPPQVRDHGEPGRLHADVLARLGAIAWINLDYPAAESYYRRALALADGLASEDPNDVTRRTFTLSKIGDLGGVLQGEGKVDEAMALLDRGLALARAASESDSADVTSLRQVASFESRLGDAARGAKRYPVALAHYREALAVRDRIVSRTGRLPDSVGERAWALVDLAGTLLDAADAADATSGRAALDAEARQRLGQTSPSEVTKPIRSIPVADFRKEYDSLTARLSRRR